VSPGSVPASSVHLSDSDPFTWRTVRLDKSCHKPFRRAAPVSIPIHSGQSDTVKPDIGRSIRLRPTLKPNAR